MREFDVLILGAGPAGSIAALILARSGRKVLLADRSEFDRPRIGETAAPELRAILVGLGLAGLLTPERHTTSPSIISRWGSREPIERNHIFSAYGSPLHLDRAAFDLALIAAAKAAGAQVELGTKRKLVKTDRGFAIGDRGGGAAGAPKLLLATGRGTRAVRLDSRRMWIDRLIGISAVVGNGFVNPSSSMLIETVAVGWIYSAPLPDSRRIVMVMTDRKLLPAGEGSRIAWWRGIVERSELVGPAIGKMEAADFEFHDARSSFLVPRAGRDWLPVGDARFAVDPLTGQGIICAVEDGIWAAEQFRIETWHTSAIVKQRTTPQLSRYIETRDYYYASEHRWPEAPFWSSIRVSSDLPRFES